MDRDARQRNRRRARAQRLKASGTKSVVNGDETGDDEFIPKTKPPRPLHRRRKFKEPLYEEDIIEGFAIASFSTYNDLERAVKQAEKLGLPTLEPLPVSGVGDARTGTRVTAPGGGGRKRKHSDALNQTGQRSSGDGYFCDRSASDDGKVSESGSGVFAALRKRDPIPHSGTNGVLPPTAAAPVPFCTAAAVLPLTAAAASDGTPAALRVATLSNELASPGQPVPASTVSSGGTWYPEPVTPRGFLPHPGLSSYPVSSRSAVHQQQQPPPRPAASPSISAPSCGRVKFGIMDLVATTSSAASPTASTTTAVSNGPVAVVGSSSGVTALDGLRAPTSAASGTVGQRAHVRSHVPSALPAAGASSVATAAHFHPYLDPTHRTARSSLGGPPSGAMPQHYPAPAGVQGLSPYLLESQRRADIAQHALAHPLVPASSVLTAGAVSRYPDAAGGSSSVSNQLASSARPSVSPHDRPITAAARPFSHAPYLSSSPSNLTPARSVATPARHPSGSAHRPPAGGATPPPSHRPAHHPAMTPAAARPAHSPSPAHRPSSSPHLSRHHSLSSSPHHLGSPHPAHASSSPHPSHLPTMASPASSSVSPHRSSGHPLSHTLHHLPGSAHMPPAPRLPSPLSHGAPAPAAARSAAAAISPYSPHHQHQLAVSAASSALLQRGGPMFHPHQHHISSAQALFAARTLAHSPYAMAAVSHSMARGGGAPYIMSSASPLHLPQHHPLYGAPVTTVAASMQSLSVPSPADYRSQPGQGHIGSSVTGGRPGGRGSPTVDRHLYGVGAGVSPLAGGGDSAAALAARIGVRSGVVSSSSAPANRPAAMFPPAQSYPQASTASGQHRPSADVLPSAANKADMLRRELDTRFLAAGMDPASAAAAGGGGAPTAAPPAAAASSSFLRAAELHQHQHTHLHHHPPSVGAPVAPSLMKPAGPKLGGVESPFLSTGLQSLSSLGQVPGVPTGPFAPPLSVVHTTKKTGRWNAMHVRIAWEIYKNQQKSSSAPMPTRCSSSAALSLSSAPVVAAAYKPSSLLASSPASAGHHNPGQPPSAPSLYNPAVLSASALQLGHAPLPSRPMHGSVLAPPRAMAPPPHSLTAGMSAPFPRFVGMPPVVSAPAHHPFPPSPLDSWNRFTRPSMPASWSSPRGSASAGDFGPISLTLDDRRTSSVSSLASPRHARSPSARVKDPSSSPATASGSPASAAARPSPFNGLMRSPSGAAAHPFPPSLDPFLMAAGGDPLRESLARERQALAMAGSLAGPPSAAAAASMLYRHDAAALEHQRLMSGLYAAAAAKPMLYPPHFAAQHGLPGLPRRDGALPPR